MHTHIYKHHASCTGAPPGPLRFPPTCLPALPLATAAHCPLPQAAVEAVVALHREDLPGDVLVFLTGQDECEAGKQGGCLGCSRFC